MTKQKIYQKINQFNNTPYDSRIRNSDPHHKKYLYVTDTIAKDRAAFLGFLLKNDPVFKTKQIVTPTILDLAFGSASLTTHIILEHFSDYKKVIYNDKITAHTFQDIAREMERAEVSQKDFLDSAAFNSVDKADVVVFNPQMRGSYKDGDSKLKDTLTPIIQNQSLKEYLQSQGKDVEEVDFEIDDEHKKITVKSNTKYQNALEKLLSGIKIYNYYDVFYQSFKSANTKEKGGDNNEPSTNVAFRRTFDKVFQPDGLLIFYGTENTFKALFADFKYVVEYRSKEDSNHLFVALKAAQDKEKRCYKQTPDGKSYIEIPNCQDDEGDENISGDLDELEEGIGELMQRLDLETEEDSLFSVAENPSILPEQTSESFQFIISDDREFPDFPYRNILLKGVPGTGKSRLINEGFIKKQLGLEINSPNVLRVNVHSASSNSDLMQGIGISTKDGQVEYREKTGLILRHLRKAVQNPYEPFVIVLEEIQENSLNELIGDLIYLIEADKRVNLRYLLEEKSIQESYKSEAAFLKELCLVGEVYFVEMPYLVSTKKSFKRMILPDNLYFFCTSNYRDDKKVIEDNLLRRFEVIEIYPKNKETIGEAFHSESVSDFLEELNRAILEEFEGKEIHPDRFMIGHAIWLNVNDEASFCRAFLRVITEFKDVKEIEFEELQSILKKLEGYWPFKLKTTDFPSTDYQRLISKVQRLAYEDLLDA